MSKFRVPVEWAMCGWVTVEAETPTEAIKTVREQSDTIPLPEDGEYIDGSFKINSDDHQPADDLAELLTDMYELMTKEDT